MSIGDLIAQIETNQRLCIGAGNPQGLFGALLLRVLRGLDGIDPRLAAAAARRYLGVYDDYQAAAEDMNPLWRVVFDSTAVHTWRQSLLISQHLALGVHAHVGHDLPLAAMDICNSKEELNAIKADFAAYSKAIYAALDQTMTIVGKFSPLSDTLELFGIHTQSDPSAHRKFAWRIAGLLVVRSGGLRRLLIQDYTRLLTDLARRIREPGDAAKPVLEFVRRFEEDETEIVSQVIEAIGGGVA